jgi:hypothetical protein
MDYHIDDAYGYVGDLGHLHRLEGMFDFLGKKGRVFQELYDNGYSEDLATLRKALKGLSSDDEELNRAVAEFREMVSRCKTILVINDGCNDYYQFDTGDQGGFESKKQQCGLGIFNDFTYKDIAEAQPPEKPGVFVIKTRKSGTDEIDINEEVIGYFSNIRWKRMHRTFETRLDKIVHMSNCPILYIGSTGTGGQTLAKRYEELSSCHPITFSLWALLQYNWKLDFGWKVINNPGKCAAELKKIYLKHHGQMPMMVERSEGYRQRNPL